MYVKRKGHDGGIWNTGEILKDFTHSKCDTILPLMKRWQIMENECIFRHLLTLLKYLIFEGLKPKYYRRTHIAIQFNYVKGAEAKLYWKQMAVHKTQRRQRTLSHHMNFIHSSFNQLNHTPTAFKACKKIFNNPLHCSYIFVEMARPLTNVQNIAGKYSDKSVDRGALAPTVIPEERWTNRGVRSLSFSEVPKTRQESLNSTTRHAKEDAS